MATSIRPVSIARDVAELMKANRRVGGAIAASQVPVPAKDRLVISTNGQPATWQLSALPYVGDLGSSLNLSLNGQELDEATDYSVDYTTGLVTFSGAQQALFRVTPSPADVLTADYLTSDDLIAQAQPGDTGVVIADTFNRADSSSTPNPASDGGTWTQDGNVWGISSNQGYATTTAAGSGLTWSALPAIRRDAGVTAFDIQADNHRINTLLSGGPISGLFGAADPVGSGGHRRGYGLLIAGGGGPVTIQIAQLLDASIGSGGVSTTVSDWLGSTATFRLTHDGAGNLTAYMGGSVILTYNDTSGFGPLGTWVGALDHSTSGSIFDAWDNFQALSL